MELRFTDEERAFRQEVRAWLDANGIARIYYEWHGTGSPKMCHRIQLFLEE